MEAHTGHTCLQDAGGKEGRVCAVSPPIEWGQAAY